MPYAKNLMKRTVLLFLLPVFLTAAGCAKCILMQSEYYDLTGKAFNPKPPEADIPLYEAGKAPQRPYTEIGAVKVVGQPGMDQAALREELKKRARLAGADALIEVQYRQDRTNKTLFCRRITSPKANAVAMAKAVVFLDSK